MEKLLKNASGFSRYALTVRAYDPKTQFVICFERLAAEVRGDAHGRPRRHRAWVSCEISTCGMDGVCRSGRFARVLRGIINE